MAKQAIFPRGAMAPRSARGLVRTPWPCEHPAGARPGKTGLGRTKCLEYLELYLPVVPLAVRH